MLPVSCTASICVLIVLEYYYLLESPYSSATINGHKCYFFLLSSFHGSFLLSFISISSLSFSFYPHVPFFLNISLFSPCSPLCLYPLTFPSVLLSVHPFSTFLYFSLSFSSSFCIVSPLSLYLSLYPSLNFFISLSPFFLVSHSPLPPFSLSYF